MSIQEKQNTSNSLQRMIITGGIIATASVNVLPAYSSVSRYWQSRFVYGLSGTTNYNPIKYYEEDIDRSSSGTSEQKYDYLSLFSPQKQNLINELIEDLMSIQTTDQESHLFFDNELNQDSFFNAFQFLIEMPDRLTMPSYDIHPDGDFSFVWQKEDTGILSLAFTNDGNVNYASYFVKNGSRHKGKVALKNLSFNGGEMSPTDEHKIIFTLVSKFS